MRATVRESGGTGMIETGTSIRQGIQTRRTQASRNQKISRTHLTWSSITSSVDDSDCMSVLLISYETGSSMTTVTAAYQLRDRE